jgi:hypothetical protein
MADMQVLDGDGTRWRVAMYFTVPGTNNLAGVNYRTALVNSGLGGTTVLRKGKGAGQIRSSQKSQVEAGKIYEHIASFRIESGGTSVAAVQASLRKFYARQEAATIDHLLRRLRYFGRTESEV